MLVKKDVENLLNLITDIAGSSDGTWQEKCKEIQTMAKTNPQWKQGLEEFTGWFSEAD